MHNTHKKNIDINIISTVNYTHKVVPYHVASYSHKNKNLAELDRLIIAHIVSWQPASWDN